MRVTLSTNTIALLSEKNSKVLEFLDEIGIPLDGSTEEANNVMRKGTKRSFRSALDAIKHVQENYPNIKMTVRTVVSRRNINDVENIPLTLEARGIDLTKFRWKLYQITPTGPRTAQSRLEADGWLISDDEMLGTVESLKQRFPDMVISSLMSKEHNERYMHIDPTGKITTLAGENPQHVFVGNIFSDEKKIELAKPLTDLHRSKHKITDAFHGVENF